MQKLLELVREECSPQVWSRAVAQARSGTLTGKRAADGSLELRMATKGGMVAPLVTLSPAMETGAASVRPWTRSAHTSPPPRSLSPRPSAKVRTCWACRAPPPPSATSCAHSRRTRGELDLALSRIVKREQTREPLTTRLIDERQKGERAQIATTRADVEIELLLGALREGPVPHAFMSKLLEWLAQCDDVSLDGAAVTIGEPVHGVRARVERQGDGFRLRVEPNPELAKVYRNGAAMLGSKLCPLRDIELSDGDLNALRNGKSFPAQETADLVGRVLPALGARMPVNAPRELLQGAEKMAPRVVLQADVLGGVLEVLPTIVYGDPPCARVDGGKLTYLGGPVALRDAEAEQALSRTLEQRLGLEVGRRRRLEGEAALKLSERVRTLDAVAVSGSGLESFRLHGALAPSLSVDGARFDLSFATEQGERASADAVIAAWQHGSPLVALEGGGFAPLPSDFLAKHGHLVAALLQARSDDELPKAALVDLAQLCDALDHPPPPDIAALRALSPRLRGHPRRAAASRLARRPSQLSARRLSLAQVPVTRGPGRPARR